MWTRANSVNTESPNVLYPIDFKHVSENRTHFSETCFKKDITANTYGIDNCWHMLPNMCFAAHIIRHVNRDITCDDISFQHMRPEYLFLKYFLFYIRANARAAFLSFLQFRRMHRNVPLFFSRPGPHSCLRDLQFRSS